MRAYRDLCIGSLSGDDLSLRDLYSISSLFRIESVRLSWLHEALQSRIETRRQLAHARRQQLKEN